MYGACNIHCPLGDVFTSNSNGLRIPQAENARYLGLLDCILNYKKNIFTSEHNVDFN